jgi:site-specific recombinase XerD
MAELHKQKKQKSTIARKLAALRSFFPLSAPGRNSHRRPDAKYSYAEKREEAAFFFILQRNRTLLRPRRSVPDRAA